MQGQNDALRQVIADKDNRTEEEVEIERKENEEREAQRKKAEEENRRIEELRRKRALEKEEREHTRRIRRENFEDSIHPTEKIIGNPTLNFTFQTTYETVPGGTLKPILNIQDHLYASRGPAYLGLSCLVNLIEHNLAGIFHLLPYRMITDTLQAPECKHWSGTYQTKTTQIKTRVLNSNHDWRTQRYDNVLKDGDNKSVHVAEVKRHYNTITYVYIPFYGYYSHVGRNTSEHSYICPYDAVIEALNISTLSRLTSNVPDPVNSFLTSARRTIESSRFNSLRYAVGMDNNALELSLDLALYSLANFHGAQVFQGGLISQKLN